MSTADKGFHDWSTSRPSWNANLKAAFMAGYRRALEDAAAAAGRKATGGLYVNELTAMAVAVGTKDGADDE